jgi:hypothetical protein
MKKLLGVLILLLVMGLVACGGSGTNADDGQDCAENPDLCPSVVPEPTDDGEL